MADFDTKVRYLETPPTSAPKTSYTIGVRILNQGVADAVAAGYVQVFDKDSGLLVKTFQVESAVIAPEQEKQAFASEVWDLTDALIGKQFILSGMVTSEGDTVPSNDILNPTTVTVIAGEPPDPPAVTPHKQQHEDGGNDEINVEGLFGQLHDPQELADHASTHEAAGGDELNVLGLRGELADRQEPKVHNNDEHSADYATLGEAADLVVQHDGLLVVHEDSTSLEHTAEKYAANGYAGLDANGINIVQQLGSNPGLADPMHVLRRERIWVPPMAGIISAVDRLIVPAAENIIGICDVPDGFVIADSYNPMLDFELFGEVQQLGVGDTLTLRTYVWQTLIGALPPRHIMTFTAGPLDTNLVFHAHMRVMMDSLSGNTFGQGDMVLVDPTGGPNAEQHVMPVTTVSGFLSMATPGTTIYATVQVTGPAVQAVEVTCNVRGSYLMLP